MGADLVAILKSVLIDSGAVWAVLGVVLVKIVDWLVGLYKSHKDNKWVDLIADLAETAYNWTEEHSVFKSYPKLGDFMKKFAELWREKTGREPDPDTQGAAAMVAAELAKQAKELPKG